MPVGEEVPGGSIGPEAAIESAKSMIGALFGLMLIRHVVVVDDEWASSLDVEVVFARLATIVAEGKQELLREVKQFDGLKLDQPREIWDSQLRGIWEHLSNEEKAEVWKQLQIDPGEISKPSWTTLEELLGSHDLAILSLQDWRLRSKDLLLEA